MSNEYKLVKHTERDTEYGCHLHVLLFENSDGHQRQWEVMEQDYQKLKAENFASLHRSMKANQKAVNE